MCVCVCVCVWDCALQVSTQGAVDGVLTAKHEKMFPQRSSYQSPSQRARLLRESKLAQHHRAFVKTKLQDFTEGGILPQLLNKGRSHNKLANHAGRKVGSTLDECAT